MIKIKYLFRTPTSIWPTTTVPVLQPTGATSSTNFDPFDLLSGSNSASHDLLQPMNSPPATTTTNKSSSNDLDFFMMSSQPTQQSSMFFPAQQQQQSFVRPTMFQQSMFPPAQQQFNKPNNNSFNVS